MKDSKVLVEITDQSVQFRFHNVDTEVFEHLLIRLYQEVPEAHWNKRIHWMVMPIYNLNKLLDFCYREFGIGQVQIQYAGKKPIEQLPLVF